MPYDSDRAITLRKLEYSETSQVLVVFTARHGKQRLIYKGARRGTKTRFATGIDALEYGDVVFTRPTRKSDALGILADWKQQSVFASLRTRLQAMYAGLYVAEITALLTADDDPHPAVFDALLEALHALADSGEPIATVVSFHRRMLDDIGLMPRFDECVGCGRTPAASEPTFFSSNEGGLLCQDCEAHRVEKRQVSSAVVQAVAAEADVPPDAQLSAFDMFDYHVTHLIGRPPKLAHLLAPPQARRTLK